MKNTKVCFYCQKELPYSQFYKMCKNKDGYQSRCKKCIRKPKLTPVELFWRKVNKKSIDECWEWKTSVDKDGYGKFSVFRKDIRAHRYSWKIHKGKIPKEMLILHHCDNPSCVNPDHLFMGTHSDNFQDMLKKGRGNKVKGEKSGTSKLKKSEVIKIKKMHETGNYTYRQIANKYNITAGNIGCIIRGETWKHV